MIIEYNGVRFALENKLIIKLDLLIDRVSKDKGEQNAYLGNHGDPGEGKTNSSIAEAIYIKSKTNRDIHLFFGTGSAIEFAKNNEKKIIIVDEPSLDNLSADAITRVAKNFLRLVNMSRIKRHFTIINLTKFWRFPKDLICDALKGMVHMDSKDGKDPGRFKYIRQKFLEPLLNDYQKLGKKRYAHYMSFGGRMPYIAKDDWAKIALFINNKPNCTYEDYEVLKHEAIGSIGDTGTKTKKELQIESKLEVLQAKIVRAAPIIAQRLGCSLEQVYSLIEISSRTGREWRNKAQSSAILLGNQGFEAPGGELIVNTMANDQKNAADTIVAEQD